MVLSRSWDCGGLPYSPVHSSSEIDLNYRTFHAIVFNIAGLDAAIIQTARKEISGEKPVIVTRVSLRTEIVRPPGDRGAVFGRSGGDAGLGSEAANNPARRAHDR